MCVGTWTSLLKSEKLRGTLGMLKRIKSTMNKPTKLWPNFCGTCSLIFFAFTYLVSVTCLFQEQMRHNSASLPLYLFSLWPGSWFLQISTWVTSLSLTHCYLNAAFSGKFSLVPYLKLSLSIDKLALSIFFFLASLFSICNVASRFPVVSPALWAGLAQSRIQSLFVEWVT